MTSKLGDVFGIEIKNHDVDIVGIIIFCQWHIIIGHSHISGLKKLFFKNMFS